MVDGTRFLLRLVSLIMSRSHRFFHSRIRKICSKIPIRRRPVLVLSVFHGHPFWRESYRYLEGPAQEFEARNARRHYVFIVHVLVLHDSLGLRCEIPLPPRRFLPGKRF